jgi:hypothetical protein
MMLLFRKKVRRCFPKVKLQGQDKHVQYMALLLVPAAAGTYLDSVHCALCTPAHCPTVVDTARMHACVPHHDDDDDDGHRSLEMATFAHGTQKRRSADHVNGLFNSSMAENWRSMCLHCMLSASSIHRPGLRIQKVHGWCCPNFSASKSQVCC